MYSTLHSQFSGSTGPLLALVLHWHLFMVDYVRHLTPSIPRPSCHAGWEIVVRRSIYPSGMLHDVVRGKSLL